MSNKIASRRTAPDNLFELALQVNLGAPTTPAGLADPSKLPHVVFMTSVDRER